jgi:hypothetical protein
MTNIYRIDPDNDHKAVVLGDVSDWKKLNDLNKKRYNGNWETIQFRFAKDKKSDSKFEPNAAIIAPCLAVRSDIAEEFFPANTGEVELLPIKVSGQDWLIFNCLASASGLNVDESVVFRDSTGIIFLIQKVVIHDQSVEDKLFFTIDGSNKSTIYALEKFVTLASEKGVKGITFAPIGILK